ncbi:MAG: 16S rRNA (cytosine(967)-C(5))-methyltransferase RsmB [Deltaproteobacteria bacterium]|nr:16S rRNA (cytosine(967)-C(5))-methyltransferase RsmB [Deltaproteobacteria bacterium]
MSKKDSASDGSSTKRVKHSRPSARSGRHRDGTPTQARLVALRVLERVETADAFADLALHHALQRNELSPVDRALTTELVYGTLRQRGRLDYLLNQLLDQDLYDLEPLVRTALRLGAYQIVCIDRVPDQAAVDEAVRCIKNAGVPRASGLVNAVLRRLCREHEQIQFPSLEKDPEGHIEHALSIPRWIAKRWIKRLGVEEAVELARINGQRAPQTIRTNPVHTTRDAFLSKIRERFPEAMATPFASNGIHLGEQGNASADPAFVAGEFTIQDEASQIVIDLLDPQSGESVLDTCAAPGTKATGIAERVGPEGSVLALDRHLHRVGLIERDARRLGLHNIRSMERDATESLSDLSPEVGFQRILVDAPCSGLGTLRRNADARWRLSPDDPTQLAALQLALLNSAAEVLQPAGVLVYSTCTVTNEENEAVVQAFLTTHPQFHLSPQEKLPNWLQPLVDEKGFLHTYPHRHQCDGFFAARLEKDA